MRKALNLGTLSLIASALLVGCGSSSSTTSDDASSETLTGYFIDAAVANVDYNTTSGLTGTTDEFGRFEYKEGDKVSLYIGKLFLGDATPEEDGILTPKTLTEGDEEQELLLLRTLQSLDEDGDASNGIVIPQDVIDDLTKIDETSMDDQNESSLIELIDTNDKQALDADYDGHIDVQDSEAIAHSENSIKEWNEGKRPDSSYENNETAIQIQEDINTTEDANCTEFNVSAYPMSTLTLELKNSLSYMGNEERLAYDVYQNLYKYHLEESATEIPQLKNISEKSEITHIQLVQDIINKYSLGAEDFTNVVNDLDLNDTTVDAMPSGQYDVPVIQALYTTLYTKGIVSTTEALFSACMVEVTDVEDLDRYILQAEISKATDIVDGFNVLRDGSYSHYWSFDQGLKDAGIENGCYVEGDALLTNKEGIYPQEENSNNSDNSENNVSDQGNGNGHRNGQDNA
jgi:hypothetical protein